MIWLTSRPTIKIIFQGDLPRDLHAGFSCLQFEQDVEIKTADLLTI